jgi:hypothetical protein
MATEVKPIKRVVGAFSANPVYDELGHRLAELAAAWRSHHDLDLVRRYHTVLLCLLELGWDEELDVELELPAELMPPEYFHRYEQSTELPTRG